MANHRAPRRSASRVDSTDTPSSTARPTGTAGKRKAVQPSRAARIRATVAKQPGRPGARTGARKNPLAALPSAPSLVGAAALVVAATGAVSIGQGNLATEATAGQLQSLTTQASVLTGSSAVHSSSATRSRELAVSRDSRREALQSAAEEELQAAAEAQAKERNAALAQLAASAEKHANEIAKNAWTLPINPGSYRLSAHFGQSSSLWASTHTGLDFAAPAGTSVMSVANGVVSSTEYAGAYGNRAVVTLEDGTEVWYCHLTTFTASPGDTLRGGDVLGTVGSTGNSTGPHLHLEIRPGAGDAVDPLAALRVHGLNP